MQVTGSGETRTLPPSLRPSLSTSTHPIEVRVTQPAGAGSAVARPIYPRDQVRPPALPTRARRARKAEPAKLTRTQAIDLLVWGIWSAAVEMEIGLSWRDHDWRAVTFEPGRLFDALAQLAWEDAVTFPLPGSPRMDGGGGGKRLSGDGTPGIPAAWLAWLDRGDVEGTRRRVHAMPVGRLAHSPIMLAQLALAKQFPRLWRAYEARVLTGCSLAEIAERMGRIGADGKMVPLSVGAAASLLDRARYELLSLVALYQGEASEEEYAALAAALR